MNEAPALSMFLKERGGRQTEIDFRETRNLLVAGGSAEDRQQFFASLRSQLAAYPFQDVRCDDFELGEYDLIDITHAALDMYKSTALAGNPPQDRFVVIEDLVPLMKGDAGFFNEAVQTLTVMSDRTRFHVVAGLGDTWRGTLADNLLAAFDARIAFRCENAQGFRVVLGRTVKNPPGRGEFYCVVKGGRTRICSLSPTHKAATF